MTSSGNPQEVLLQSQMSVKIMILSSRKSIEDEPVPITYFRSLSFWGGDKPKTLDRLSCMEANGANRISVFRRELYMVNGKFEAVCPVGFCKVGQCGRFRMVFRVNGDSNSSRMVMGGADTGNEH